MKEAIPFQSPYMRKGYSSRRSFPIWTLPSRFSPLAPSVLRWGCFPRSGRAYEVLNILPRGRRYATESHESEEPHRTLTDINRQVLPSRPWHCAPGDDHVSIGVSE